MYPVDLTDKHTTLGGGGLGGCSKIQHWAALRIRRIKLHLQYSQVRLTAYKEKGGGEYRPLLRCVGYLYIGGYYQNFI